MGTLAAIRERDGDLAVRYLGRQRMILLFDPLLIEQVFVDGSKAVDKKNHVRRWWVRRPVMGQRGPLFETHDRDAHRAARRVLHPAFAKERAAGTVAEMQEAMDAVATAQEDAGATDLARLLSMLMVGGFLSSTFGAAPSLDWLRSWVDSRAVSSSFSGWPMVVSPYYDLVQRVLQFSRPGPLRRALAAQAQLEELTAPYLVDPAPQTLPALFHAAGSGDDVSRLVAMIVTASETATYLMRGVLAVASDPALADSLRDEIARGDDRALHEAVVKESLRLTSMLTIGRYCQSELRVGGQTFREDDFVMISPYLMHRDERWWPDPERFDPHRWADDSRPRCAFIPFGAGGPRICAGRHQVLQLMRLGLEIVNDRWRLELLGDPGSVGWRKLLPQNDVVPDRRIGVKLVPGRRAVYA